MITKIISGGQTGADTGGLVAAKHFNLMTGGWMPKGYRRLNGNYPSFKELYGMLEHSSPTYQPRTELNVQESDGTVRFAKNFNSPGEICTLKAIKKHQKPYFDVDINNPPDKSEFLKWIKDKDIKILNVAGNAEQTAPGTFKFVVNYLVESLKESLCT